MRELVRAFLVWALIGAVPGQSLAGSGAIGTWTMDSGKVTVRISPCGGSLCGTVVTLSKPLDKNGKPKLDKKNPNPALRKRPVVGLTILSAMKPDGDSRWAGRIYNADDGHTYQSYMKLDGDAIKVKGCVAFICKKMTFRRVD
jgi:uncharacterized protein (DUF2147 family)